MEIIKEQRLMVNGLQTRLWQAGKSGLPVVLVHGLGASVETWAQTLPALAGSCQAYAMDLVGFGYADKPAIRYTLTELADFLGGALQALQLEQAVLVGHSLGGAVCLKLSLDQPQRVVKLVLVDSAGLGRSGGWGYRLMALPGVGERLTRPDRPGTRKALAPLFYDPARLTEAFVDLNYTLIRLEGAQGAYLKTVRSLGGFWGLKREVTEGVLSRLEQVQAPTLIVWGRQDKVLPASHGEAAALRIPGSQLQQIENCGHLPMIEQPEIFNQLLLDFIRD